MQIPTTTPDFTEASQKAKTRHTRAWYKHLSFQILIAMVLGVIVGYVRPQSADALKPLGDLFIKLVRMLVAPIIFCTVVHGIASVGEAKKVGRVAIKSLIYFEVVTTIAMVIAAISFPYSLLFASLSGRMVEPSRDIPAKTPFARE